jgi:hypothetical protein
MEIKDVVGLSEPLKRLIEVIAQGVGALSKPYLIKKNAEAKAHEIRVISKAIADSQVLLGGTDYEDGKIKIISPSQGYVEQASLSSRSESRQTYQELRKQQNIESICAEAVQEMLDETKVSEVKPEADWINRFFEIAENISTEDLQLLWGKILAGEIRDHGSFSLRTLETLKNMSRQEAEIFCRLGKYVFYHENIAVYLEPEGYIFKQEDSVNFTDILALKDAGIVADSDILNLFFDTTSQFLYGNLVLLFEQEKDVHRRNHKIGALTKAGAELLKLVSIEPDMEYVKYIAQQFYSEGFKFFYAPILDKKDNSIRTGDKTYLEFK